MKVSVSKAVVESAVVRDCALSTFLPSLEASSVVSLSGPSVPPLSPPEGTGRPQRAASFFSVNSEYGQSVPLPNSANFTPPFFFWSFCPIIPTLSGQSAALSAAVSSSCVPAKVYVYSIDEMMVLKSDASFNSVQTLFTLSRDRFKSSDVFVPFPA